MSFFITAFSQELRRRTKAMGTWLMLLPALALVLLALHPAGGKQGALVQVGLVLPDTGGEAFYRLLQERSSQLIQFHVTDQETMEKQILTCRWDCGLVLPEDFDRRVENREEKGLVTLVTGPGSAVYPLVRETAAACLIQLMSPAVAGEYLKDMGMDSDQTEQIMARIGENTQRVQVTLQTLDGERMDPVEATDSTFRRLALGLTGVVLLAWGLYLAVDLGRWLQTEQARRLAAVLPRLQLLLPRALAAWVPAAALGAAATWLGQGSWPALLGFLGVVGMGSIACSRYPRLWRGIEVLMPFLVMFCLIFEPVLVDVTALFPRLSPWLGWLPLGLFLRGGGANTLALLAWTAALLIIAILPPRKKVV